MLLPDASLISSEEHLKRHRQWSPWAKKPCGLESSEPWAQSLLSPGGKAVPALHGLLRTRQSIPDKAYDCHRRLNLGLLWAPVDEAPSSHYHWPLTPRARLQALCSLAQAHLAQGLPIPAPRREGHTLFNLGPLQFWNLTQLRRHRYDHPLLLLPNQRGSGLFPKPALRA